MSVLPTMLLVVGALLTLGGVVWSAWQRLNAPPAPVESAAGAVVLAQAAPDALGLPTLKAATGWVELPTAALDPNWTLRTAVTDAPPQPEWTAVPSAGRRAGSFYRQPQARVMERAELPTATPRPTLTPTPTPPPEPPTRIVAPAIKLDAKVQVTKYHVVKRGGRTYSEWLVPKNAAGWHETSAFPGQPGNTVLSGHHNIDGKVFRYVVNLEPGDEITLYAGDKTFRYIVVEKYILKEAGMPLSVRQKNAQWIATTDDIRLTLITCWPYEYPGNTHRVVVVAKPGW